MTAGWPYTALRATLQIATHVPATDGQTNAEMNCATPTTLERIPTALENRPTMLECGGKEFVLQDPQQFLTYNICAGHSVHGARWGRVRENPYRAHFPTRYRGFQFHPAHVIGATPMMRYTPTPKTSPAVHEEVS